MNNHPITDELNQIPPDDNFASNSMDVVDTWIADGVGIEAIEPILRFMEEHPSIDFGVPGSLVQFVERFYRKGYEEKLIASVRRKPTLMTVWMLHRLLNGAESIEEKSARLRDLEDARENPNADSAAVDMANRFLNRRLRK
jgi:hypothetical protein